MSSREFSEKKALARSVASRSSDNIYHFDERLLLVSKEYTGLQRPDKNNYDFLSSDAEDAGVDISWLSEAYDYGVATPSSDLLIRMISGINKLLKQRMFRLIDQILDNSDYTHVSPEFTVAILRTTYAVKSELKNWRDALKRASSGIESQGHDAKSILSGLA